MLSEVGALLVNDVTEIKNFFIQSFFNKTSKFKLFISINYHQTSGKSTFRSH